MKTRDNGRVAIFQFKPHKTSLLNTLIAIWLGSLVLAGCSASPQNAFAIKTAEYGQCRALKKSEGIRYKNRLVSYVCEDSHVLFGQPYQREEEWYFKSGKYDGIKVREISEVKVDKRIHGVCHFEGTYGTGDKHIRKFYFDTKLKACRPFDWSGKGGIVPFESQDVCEKNCYY